MHTYTHTHLLKLVFPNYDVECTGRAKDNNFQTEKKGLWWSSDLNS